MANGLTRPGIPNDFDTLFRFGVVGDLSDEQLLHRFLTAPDGADEAFTALVQRHGPMVLRVCREVLGSAHDAQDASQATFLVLARRAAAIRRPESLAGWLHEVAHRIATRARLDAARRRTHESQGGATRAVAAGCDAGRDESCAILHEEVARLPGRYREPVVLCYLEGLSTEEAALRIGCPLGTVYSRLSRARERLRGRLARRGLEMPAAWLAAGWEPAAKASLPAGFLGAAVRSSRGFAVHRVVESGSAPAVALARGMLGAMMVARLRLLAAAGLACALALGGARASGWFGPPDGAQELARPSPDDDPQAAMMRSVDRLQHDLEETARRNDGMRKELSEIRARLEAVGRARARAVSVVGEAVARFADALDADPARAAARLAEALRRHPARRIPREGNCAQIYLMDLVQGGTTLIADQPAPGLDLLGVPRWSHDGRRIVFDATPQGQWRATRLMALEVVDGQPEFTDLGPGNCPNFSPDDRRIAFHLVPGAQPGAEAGVWVMKADGSDRRRVGDGDIPFWSPDGRRFLVNGLSEPTESLVFDLETRTAGRLEIPGHRIFSWPRWSDPRTLVSALETGDGGQIIALIDVARPDEPKIGDVLWKRGPELDVAPRWPIFRPGTRQCFFVGVEPRRRTLFSIERGTPGGARRVERGGHGDRLAGPSFSPDGRYLLFSDNWPGPG